MIQKPCGSDHAQNIAEMADLVDATLDAGADIVLPQELFAGPYFCQSERQELFSWASPVDEDPGIVAIRKVTAGRGAVVPVSFFERAGQAHYNSVAVVEDGEVLGIYRKSHIPDGPGYEEKFYFNPGDTGFRVVGDAARHDRGRDLLGPVVPRGRSRDGAARRRRAAVPDRDRQ